MKHFEANFFVYPTQLKLNANSRFHALLARSFALRRKKKRKKRKSCHRHCRTRASSTDRNFSRGRRGERGGEEISGPSN